MDGWEERRVTSLKKRLDYVLEALSALGTEPDGETADNIAAQLSIIEGAFRESADSPVCCFRLDAQSQFVCDCNGPLNRAEFMKKCRVCQAQIKQALSVLHFA